MTVRFVCTHCDRWKDVDPLTCKEGDPHDGCPEGSGHWLEVPEYRSKCPHGLDWADCNPCMIAGDLAFDAAREGRYR